MANDKRDAVFTIRANDQTAAGSRSAEQNVDKVTAALARQAAQATRTAEAAMNSYSKTSAALDATQKKALDTRKAYDAFADSLSGVSEPTKKQVRDFNALGAAAERADADVAKLQSTLEKQANRFNDRTDKAAALTAEAQAVRELAAQEEVAYKKAEQASLRHAAALEHALELQREMQQLSAFRKVGQDAEQAVGGLDRYTTASKVAAGGTADLQTRLRSLLDPAQQARSTLAGLEAEAARLAGAVGDSTKPLRDLQDEIYDLGRAQQAILKQASSIDAYRNQSVAVDRAADAYERARAEVLRLAQAIKASDAPSDELIGNLRQAEAAAEGTATQLDRERNALARLKQGLDNAGISTKNLTNEEKRLQVATEQVVGSLKKVDAAQKGTNNKTGAFLGLRPYELTNLGYQVNDIFTQLASGTPILQILGQQGGQVLQLFPKIMSAALAAAPAIVTVGLALGTVAAGMARILENEALTREFNATLGLNVDGLRYNAEELVKNTRELQRYGISVKDAKKGLKEFIEQGVDASKLVEYSKAAKDLSEVLGVDVVDAQKKVSTAFTGGYKQIAELDNQLNFLTLTEREHIKTLFDQGDAVGATDEAFKKFYDRAEDAAEKQRGPWKQATIEFGNAWQDFLDGLAGSDNIKILVFELQGLVNMATSAARILRGAKSEATSNNGFQVPSTEGNSTPVAPGLKRRGFFDKLVGGDWLDIGNNFKRRETITAATKGVGALAQTTEAEKASQRQSKLAQDLVDKYEDQVKATDKLNKAQRLKLAGDKAVNEATEKGVKAESELLRVRQAAEKLEGIKADKDIASKNRSDSSKANAAEAKARAEQNARDSIERTIVQAESAMNAKIAKQQKTDLTARLRAVDETYSKVFADIQRFQDKGGKSIEGVGLDEVRARLEANKQLLKDQEKLSYFEESIAAKTDERKAALKAVTDEYTAGQISATAAFQKTEQTQKDLGPGIAQMADDAVAFAEGINAAKPSDELRAYIRTMQGTGKAERQRGTPNDPAKDTAKLLLGGEESKLNSLLQQRATLVATLKEQYDAGLISLTEYRAKSLQAFQDTQPAIQGASAAFRDILTQIKGVISPELYDTWILKLGLVDAAAKGIDETLVATQQQIEQTFTGGVVDLVDQLGTAIGSLVDGTLSFGGAIRSVWDAFRSFAADFLRQIAMMIAQQAVLNALKGAASSGKGGFFTKIAKLVVGASTGATVKHNGGMGGEGPTHQLPLSMFANAPRYHNGYAAGLDPTEQAAIIKKNEEVLTADDPRHINNLGKGGGGSGPPIVNLKNVNVFDSSEVVSKGIASRPGEQAVLNVIRENPAAVKSALGVS